MTNEVIKKLSEAALDVRKKAYCPYSGFAVGACSVVPSVFSASVSPCPTESINVSGNEAFEPVEHPTRHVNIAKRQNMTANCFFIKSTLS